MLEGKERAVTFGSKTNASRTAHLHRQRDCLYVRDDDCSFRFWVSRLPSRSSLRTFHRENRPANITTRPTLLPPRPSHRQLPIFHLFTTSSQQALLHIFSSHVATPGLYYQPTSARKSFQFIPLHPPTSSRPGLHLLVPSPQFVADQTCGRWTLDRHIAFSESHGTSFVLYHGRLQMPDMTDRPPTPAPASGRFAPREHRILPLKYAVC